VLCQFLTLLYLPKNFCMQKYHEFPPKTVAASSEKEQFPPSLTIAGPSEKSSITTSAKAEGTMKLNATIANNGILFL